MDFLQIEGPAKLSGEVKISGAKNAALPLLALSLISSTPYKLTNLPEVADVRTFMRLLEQLGASISLGTNTATIDTSSVNHQKATYDIVKTMRASILVLGPLLARFGYCEVSLPGGCAIGARPVDLHIKALEQMGAKITIENGYIKASTENGLRGAEIEFEKITVTGSENIIAAAALASGTTKLKNVAIEPEVVQLCEVLTFAGVEIKGIGTRELEITGSSGQLLALNPTFVIPDRIEAGTYLVASAITKCPIKICNVLASHLGAILGLLEEIGFSIAIKKNVQNLDDIAISTNGKMKNFKIITAEYPDFPTDMQAQFMALATRCEGKSIIEERLFENRFMHVSELQRLGANIKIESHKASIHGSTDLIGADVMATDLRASSALILAALIASGTTKIHRIYHLDRGYENLEKKLKTLGVNIKRDKEKL